MASAKIANAVDKHVGSCLHSRRMMLGLSQTDVGNALGLTFQQVQKYERGANRISSSTLHQVSQALKVAPEYFFEGAPDQSKKGGKTSPPDYVSEFLATADGLALAKAFSRLKNAKLGEASLDSWRGLQTANEPGREEVRPCRRITRIRANRPKLIGPYLPPLARPRGKTVT